MADAKYLIVGGGCTSAGAAVAIREHDREGSVILVTREKRWPYDRPPLSKDFLQNDAMKPDDPESKDPSWYPVNDVEVRQGVQVQQVDSPSQTVTFADGAHLSYEKLILATGASPVRPDLPGADLENVFFLRTVDDAERIRDAIRRGGRAVMVGGGYIGLEVAASATERGVHCTVIERGDRPWARFGSPAAGAYVQKRFERAGVVFEFRATAARIVGNRKVESVRTIAGKEFPADFVVVGVGAKLNTDLAKSAGLKMDDAGAVEVNDQLQTSEPNIFAAGDIASFVDAYTGERNHLEHYMNASWQGAAVGASASGHGEPYAKVPYFFSDMFDIHMALRGSTGGELVTTIGNVEGGNFVELYRGRDGKLRMGLIVCQDAGKLDPLSDKVEALIEKHTTMNEVAAGEFADIA